MSGRGSLRREEGGRVRRQSLAKKDAQTEAAMLGGWSRLFQNSILAKDGRNYNWLGLTWRIEPSKMITWFNGACQMARVSWAPGVMGARTLGAKVIRAHGLWAPMKQQHKTVERPIYNNKEWWAPSSRFNTHPNKSVLKWAFWDILGIRKTLWRVRTI